jgi:CxxC motif-containing protein (DUF1111 family)
MFGLGLVEAIQDSTIVRTLRPSLRAAVGISGIPNRSTNDGTITRFGWKVQNKSLSIFLGEAYNVEMGVTNDVFPTSTEEAPNHTMGNNQPNDITRTDLDDSRNQALKQSATHSAGRGWSSRSSCSNWRPHSQPRFHKNA